jgi:hypothetical protein
MKPGWYFGAVHDRTGREKGAEVALLADSFDAPRAWLSVQGPFETADRAEYVARSLGLPTRRYDPMRGEAEQARREGRKAAHNVGACRGCHEVPKSGRLQAGLCNACYLRERRRRQGKVSKGRYYPRKGGYIRPVLRWDTDEDYEGQGLAGCCA